MVMKVVTFKLPAEYVDALGAKAAASEVSVSQLLRNVVDWTAFEAVGP